MGLIKIHGEIVAYGGGDTKPDGTFYKYIDIDTPSGRKHLKNVIVSNRVVSLVTGFATGTFYLAKAPLMHVLAAAEVNGQRFDVRNASRWIMLKFQIYCGIFAAMTFIPLFGAIADLSAPYGQQQFVVVGFALAAFFGMAGVPLTILAFLKSVRMPSGTFEELSSKAKTIS